jgi:hypothetical protein
MHVEATHSLGREQAQHRLESVADGLAGRSWPGGIEVQNFTRTWDGDRLNFSFVLARGFFRASIAGTLFADESSAAIETDVPGMIVMLVGEDRLRAVIQQELEQALAT